MLNLLNFQLLEIAHAQSTAAPSAGGAPGIWAQLLPFVFMFLIFYILILRPQAKKQKTHQDFLAKLKRGDEVITSSGILGKIEGLTENFITLEVSQGVKIKILKSQVSGPFVAAQPEGAKS